jgi:predicted anti-sigma-YlaC factor YlaD
MPEQQSIPELVRSVVTSGQRYALAQRALIQTEMKRAGREAGMAGAFAAVAIGTATLFAIFLLLTIAWALVQLGLQTWAGFGIVALALLVLTLIMAALAKKKADAIRGPELAIKADVARTAQDIRDLTQG